MLTNYARWYSFTPPQWPTLSPPLTVEPPVGQPVGFLLSFVGFLLGLIAFPLGLDEAVEPARYVFRNCPNR